MVPPVLASARISDRLPERRVDRARRGASCHASVVAIDSGGTAPRCPPRLLPTNATFREPGPCPPARSGRKELVDEASPGLFARFNCRLGGVPGRVGRRQATRGRRCRRGLLARLAGCPSRRYFSGEGPARRVARIRAAAGLEGHGTGAWLLERLDRRGTDFHDGRSRGGRVRHRAETSTAAKNFGARESATTGTRRATPARAARPRSMARGFTLWAPTATWCASMPPRAKRSGIARCRLTSAAECTRAGAIASLPWSTATAWSALPAARVPRSWHSTRRPAANCGAARCRTWATTAATARPMPRS